MGTEKTSTTARVRALLRRWGAQQPSVHGWHFDAVARGLEAPDKQRTAAMLRAVVATLSHHTDS
ncbi:MAG: hypothetical protein ACPGUV_07990 [Polyangiales bacterium]